MGVGQTVWSEALTDMKRSWNRHEIKKKFVPNKLTGSIQRTVETKSDIWPLNCVETGKGNKILKVRT